MSVGLSPTDLKKSVDRTGNAHLTLFNDYEEVSFIGNLTTLTNRNGRLYFAWGLPKKVEHISPFTKAVISDGDRLLWASEISPVRLDRGLKKYEIEIGTA